MEERRIRITANKVVLEAALNDSPSAVALWESLPISAQASTWGDEIYFSIPVEMELDEWARETVDLGAVAYWPPGSALCLFFGLTPASQGDEIRPASAVNLLGMIDENAITLKQVPSGALITIEAI